MTKSIQERLCAPSVHKLIYEERALTYITPSGRIGAYHPTDGRHDVFNTLDEAIAHVAATRLDCQYCGLKGSH